MAKKRTVPGLIRVACGGAIVRPSSATDTEPKWNHLFPIGTFHRGDFPGGELKFDRTFLKSMLDNWVKGGRKAKPVDSLHRGDSGEDGLPAEEKAARGWIEDLKLQDDGLWGLVRWNAKGLAFVLSDEYRYISPSFHPDWVDSHTGDRQGPTLFGAGLVNNPFLEELPRVAADVVGDQPKENTVNKKLLCARLGLAEDSTDEQINAALQKEADAAAIKLANDKAVADKAEKDAAALKLANANLDTVKGELTKLSAEVVKLQATNANLEKERADKAVADLCAKLESEGRIIAADKPRVAKCVAAMGLKDATEFTDTWPVKVALGERGIGGNGDEATPSAAKARLDALTEDFAKKNGLKLSEARLQVLAMNEHRDLVEAASKLTSPTKN